MCLLSLGLKMPSEVMDISPSSFFSEEVPHPSEVSMACIVFDFEYYFTTPTPKCLLYLILFHVILISVVPDPLLIIQLTETSWVLEDRSKARPQWWVVVIYLYNLGSNFWLREWHHPHVIESLIFTWFWWSFFFDNFSFIHILWCWFNNPFLT